MIRYVVKKSKLTLPMYDFKAIIVSILFILLKVSLQISFRSSSTILN